MRTFLLSLVLAGAAMAQLKSPGVFRPVESAPQGEVLVIPIQDPSGFALVPYVQVLFYQSLSPMSTVGYCNVYVDHTPSQVPQVWMTDASNVWHGPYPFGTAIKLTNNLCTLDVAQSAIVQDPADVRKGKLVLSLTYAPGAPKNLFLLAPSYSDNSLSLSRQRPACPTPAELVNNYVFGCSQ